MPKINNNKKKKTYSENFRIPVRYLSAEISWLLSETSDPKVEMERREKSTGGAKKLNRYRERIGIDRISGRSEQRNRF